MIITGGENVAPAEVEAVLAEHPGVAEAAVFARPHPIWGEAITALIVPRAGRSARPRRAARPLPGAARAVQGPEGVRARGGAAAHRLGQGAARASCASVRAGGPPRRLPQREPQALGRAGRGLGRAAGRDAHADDAGLGLDDRRARPAARPDAARARGRPRRHRAARRGADRARRHADLVGLRARDAPGRPAARRGAGDHATSASSRSTPTRASTSRPAASTACSAAGATC